MIYKTFNNVNRAVIEADKAREFARKEILEYLKAVCEEAHCVSVSPFGFLTIYKGQLQAIENVKGDTAVHSIENATLESLMNIAQQVHEQKIVEEFDYENIKTKEDV